MGSSTYSPAISRSSFRRGEAVSSNACPVAAGGAMVLNLLAKPPAPFNHALRESVVGFSVTANQNLLPLHEPTKHLHFHHAPSIPSRVQCCPRGRGANW